MKFTKSFTHKDILDLDQEYAIDRPVKFSFKEFLIICFKSPKQTERIACRYGITKDEYIKTKSIIDKFTLSLSVIMTIIFVLLFALFYSSFNKLDFWAISLYVNAFVFTAVSIIYLIIVRKIHQGLLFHAMNYWYVNGTSY